MSTAGYVVITTQGGSTVVQVTTTAIVNILTSGPQGPTGATGSQGNQGPTGVVAATAPITYNSGTQTVGITAATQSAAGSMSAADKIKLDNSIGLAAGLAIALG